MLKYFGELRLNWPTLLGSCLGLALGAAINHYILNLFGPALIQEFGWAKSEFALVGSLTLVTMLFVPIAGRFADRFGPRIAAGVGFAVVPLAFLAFSFMTGDIWQFYAITLVKNSFGILTTTLVFCRVIVERFDAMRGVALSILMSGAPLVGAIAVPIIGEVVDSEGWRAGYRTLAALSAFGGITAIALIGPRRHERQEKRAPSEPISRRQLMSLFRNPVFILLILGMFLCNLPQVIVASQLKLVLLESGAASSFATWLVSLYAVAVVIGRFISGFALDQIEAHIVALFSLGLPAIGFLGLASSFDAQWLLAGSIALIGLAQGAEGDVGAYLCSRKFDLRHYSFVYSFLIASIGAASAVGSLILSYTLHRTDSFDSFLLLAAVVSVIGAACFYLTGRIGGSGPVTTTGQSPTAQPA